MANDFIVAAAGGGKTTRIVREASAATTERIALVTYTNNNAAEIARKTYAQNGMMPRHMEISTWFGFLLHEMARPYQRALYQRRIAGLHFVEGRSPYGVAQADVRRFYFSAPDQIFSDKLSRFVCECDIATNGAVTRRLEERFSHIYIDEMQDISGPDLDLVERLLKSSIKVTLIGDHRQATFKTNHGQKNKAYAGSHIVEKLRQWEARGLGKISFDQTTRRCHQSIADLADTLFPNEPCTVSENKIDTGHDGVFVLPTNSVANYVSRFEPQVLRLDAKTPCHPHDAMNFGAAKGLTFDRVLIFPHQKGTHWVRSGDLKHISAPQTLTKIYVGLTRARHSVAIVFDGVSSLKGVVPYV